MSETDIANMALGHLGIGKEIANISTERSQEALACNRYYEIARDTTLRAFPWPFATKFRDLAVVEENPTDEWAFSYRYPVDCFMVRRVLSGSRNDSRQGRVPYKIGQDASGMLIYTDETDATIEHTVRVTDATRFPDDFVLALSFKLAALCATRITAGDPFKLGDKAEAYFKRTISDAQADAANEEQPDELPESEFIAGRS